jgi:hypothetical protein
MSNDSIRIRKTTIPNKFVLVWRDIQEHLVLDFNPIINGFYLTEYSNFVLIHWQGKPKGLRTWGMYDSQTQNYYSDSFEGNKEIYTNNQGRLLQLNENIHKTLPTAVVCIPNYTIEQVLALGGGYGQYY